MKHSNPKNITKTILFFANNLFPNVYYIVRTLRSPKEAGRRNGPSALLFAPVPENTAKTNFFPLIRPFPAYIYMGRVRNAGRTR